MKIETLLDSILAVESSVGREAAIDILEIAMLRFAEEQVEEAVSSFQNQIQDILSGNEEIEFEIIETPNDRDWETST